MANAHDVVEFYLEDDGRASVLLRIYSCIVPLVGQKISIEKVTYDVVFVSFAVDFASMFKDRQMRANVKLVKETAGS